MDINSFAEAAEARQASDIHISSNMSPYLRIYGEMVPLKISPLTPSDMENLLKSIMSEELFQQFKTELEVDFSYQVNDKLRFRVNAFHNMEGPAAVMRLVPYQVKTLEDLQVPEIFYKLANLEKGIILVTGATGSGKSTTVAALVNQINENHAKHIITIEDPIEFVHKSKKALISQRELGSHTKSYTRALISALREDPDVIIVGEMRDVETIHLALAAAETGHLVISTLHTNSAAKTIDRIIDVFPGGEREMIRAMLSNSIEAVISQTLIRRKDQEGRVAAYEVMLAAPAVRNLIRENKISQLSSVIQMNKKLGMNLMEESIKDLVAKSIINPESGDSVLNKAEDKPTPPRNEKDNIF